MTLYFKSVDDILKHFGWGGDTKGKEDKQDDNTESHSVSGTSEDSEGSRDAG